MKVTIVGAGNMGAASAPSHRPDEPRVGWLRPAEWPRDPSMRRSARRAGRARAVASRGRRRRPELGTDVASGLTSSEAATRLER